MYRICHLYNHVEEFVIIIKSNENKKQFNYVINYQSVGMAMDQIYYIFVYLSIYQLIICRLDINNNSIAFMNAIINFQI